MKAALKRTSMNPPARHQAITLSQAVKISDTITGYMGLPACEARFTGKDERTERGWYGANNKGGVLFLHTSGENLDTLLHELAHHVQYWTAGGKGSHTKSWHVACDAVQACWETLTGKPVFIKRKPY